MSSSYNCVKSLKDSLLEYAVLKMDLLFPAKASKYDIYSIPIFPSNLFDEIIEMSKIMWWVIPDLHKSNLVSAIDRLKWSDRSFFGCAGSLEVKDLEPVLDRLHTFQTLRVKTTDGNRLSDLLKLISKAADTLEDLHINIEQYGYIFRSEETAITFKKLKKVDITLLRMEHFQYNFYSDKLTVFILYGAALTKPLLKALGNFKQLNCLSIFYYTEHRLETVKEEEVIDVAASMKCLRSFSLIGLYHDALNELMLNKITKNMENLEILEIYQIKIKDSTQLLTPRKKLKVINVAWLNGAESSPLSYMAESFGHFANIDGLIRIISTTPTPYFYKNAVETLHRRLPNKKKEILERMTEAEKTGTFKFSYPDKMVKTIYSETYKGYYYDILQRMICHVMCRAHPSYSVKWVENWIWDFIPINENTYLSEKLKSIISTLYPYKNRMDL